MTSSVRIVWAMVGELTDSFPGVGRSPSCLGPVIIAASVIKFRGCLFCEGLGQGPEEEIEPGGR